MCCCLWLFPHSQAAGIGATAGEKVTVICRRLGVRSLKAAYNKQVLPAEGGGGLMKKKKRAGRITTHEINASTKLSKLTAVITDQSRESVDL